MKDQLHWLFIMHDTPGRPDRWLQGARPLHREHHQLSAVDYRAAFHHLL